MKNLLMLIILFAITTLPAVTVAQPGLNVQEQPYPLERVEPLHWWTGMQNPELQLLFYGNDIGQLTPSIDYPGVAIRRVQRVENDNYLFVYLHIARETRPGTMEISLTKGEEVSVSVNYQLRERTKNSAGREGFNSTDAIYLITPDRFANGNPGNDYVEGYADTLDRKDDYARHGGDLQGIIDNLDYIAEIGFTAIWLNPVLENAMPEASYHGYATTDYYKVDPRFGNNELYKKLSQEAQKRGIKLIMDMIMNHSGSSHWWMKDPPASDWVHYQDEHRITSHRRRTLQDPYASDMDRQRFTDGWFVSAMPDLNQDNPLMADYLIYNSLWWIEYANLRGIRHDTHPYAGQKFMQEWTCRIMEEYPDFNIVGEEWSVDPAVLAKWQRGNKLIENFDSCLPSLMDFPLQVALLRALTEEERWDRGWITVYEILTNDFLYMEPQNMVIFADNHDMDRFFRQVKGDYDLYKMGLTYIFTMRGIPKIYYGTELLMSNQQHNDHGEIREDFPGGWENDSVNAFSGKGLTGRQKEAQQVVRKLANWRKDNPVIHHGKLMQYAPRHDGIYLYFRYNEEQTVMVVFNKNRDAFPLDTGYYYERLEGFSTGKDVVTGKTYSLENLEIPPRSALILELK